MATLDFEPNWDDLFQEIQQEMAAWRRQHPKATMRAIELESERLLARLHARVVQDVAAASPAADFAHQPAEARPTCPDCQVPLQARGKKGRSLRAHGNQPVPLEREYGSCPQCGQAFFPSR
jgi:hypothetical protein